MLITIKKTSIYLIVLSLLASIYFITISLVRASGFRPEKIKKPILILDEQKEIAFNSSKVSQEQIIKQSKLKVYKEDKVYSFPDPRLGYGTIIKIERATPVYVKDGAKEEKIVRTWQKRVKGVLTEKNLSLGNKDKINYQLSDGLKPGMRIKIDRIGWREVKENESIDYQTDYRPDNTMVKGESRVETEGRAGEKELVYRVKYVNGRATKRKLKSEKIISPPQNKMIYYGTLPKVVSTNYGTISIYNGDLTASSYYQTGDRLRITNPSTGETVIVRVDSGCPHCGPNNRLMDLERSSFSKLVRENLWDTGIITGAKVEKLAY